MKNRTFALSLLCVGAAFVISTALFCWKFPEKPQSPVIARVGRSVLTLDDLNTRIPAEYSSRIGSEQRINYVKQWLDTELLYQEALRQHIDKEKDIRQRLEKMKKDLLSAEMINRNAFGAASRHFPEESIAEYYQRHRGSYIRESDVVKYVEIVVDDLKTGWKVRNAVTQDNFFELASQYSSVPAQDPHTVPYIPVNSLPPQIAEVIFTIRISGTTSPVQLPDGVHILRVLDKQKAGDTCLVEEVKDEIVSALSTQSQKTDIENLLAQLREKTDYEFHFDLLAEQAGRADESSGVSAGATDSTEHE